MKNKNILGEFIKIIYNRKMITKFLINIFDYNINDNNYIFRIIEKDDKIIIDIYDNISNTKFNRYIFIFNKCNYVYKLVLENNIYNHYLSVIDSTYSDSKLLKLAYLFKLKETKMLEYSHTFLYPEFIDILKDIIK